MLFVVIFCLKIFYEAAQLLKNRNDLKFIFVGNTYEGNKSSADKKFVEFIDKTFIKVYYNFDFNLKFRRNNGSIWIR